MVRAASESRGVRHDGPGGQPARQAVQPDEEDDVGPGKGQDARPAAAAAGHVTATLTRRMVRIRLRRVGSRRNPNWRIVVADRRSPRDGRTIETLGHYNPRTDPSVIELDAERARHWLDHGAQPTRTVATLLRTKGIEA